MAAGATWQRRLPSLMRFARVVAASQAAGSYEPQMMPAHKAVDLAGRLTRLSAMRKAVAVEGLAKALKLPKLPSLEGFQSKSDRGVRAANTRWGEGGFKATPKPVLAERIQGRHERKTAQVNAIREQYTAMNTRDEARDAALRNFMTQNGIKKPPKSTVVALRRLDQLGLKRKFLVANPDYFKNVFDGALAKSAPAVPALIFRPAEPITLQKWLGAAANVAAFALPMAAGTARGQRAISWAGRKVMSGGQSVGRAFGGKSPRPRMQDNARSGMSGFSKFRRNPGRAVMATNRGIYNNRGSILLGTGTAIGGYEADRAWRNATPKQRAQGNVRV